MLAGGLLGLALLTKLLLLPFLPFLVLFFGYQAPGSWQKQVGKVLLISGTLVLTILPTMWYNAERHGRWMVADSSVFNVWVGLNDIGSRDYRHKIAGPELEQFEASGATFIERTSQYRQKIIDFVAQKGVFSVVWAQSTKQYARLFHAETSFTTQLPGGPRQSYRFSAFPWAPVLRWYAYVMHGLVLGLGVLGLCFLQLRPIGWPHLLGLFVVYNLGLFLAVHVKTRYMIQIFPVLMIFSAVALDRLLEWWNTTANPSLVHTSWSLPAAAYWWAAGLAC